MQRAMARQAEAERERRAKVINAEGEFQASERLKDAALVIERAPIALQLRYLQTLLELGSSQSTTIVFPAPVDSARAAARRSGRGQGPPSRATRRGRRRRRLCSRNRRAASIAAPRFRPLSLRLLDQHHGLDRVHVVDPLLLALGRDLRLVRPVVELHLRDAGEPAHLAEVELDLVEMLCEVDRARAASACFEGAPCLRLYIPRPAKREGDRSRPLAANPRASARGARSRPRRPRGTTAPERRLAQRRRAPERPCGQAAPRRGPRRPGRATRRSRPRGSRITITPCVERPSRFTSSTGILITVPPVEISITW